MSRRQIIAVDFDHTLYDTTNDRPYPGSHEALDRFHEKGFDVMIHSCNNPAWIRRKCEEFNFRVEYVWGETSVKVPKPVCAVFVDDRAIHFDGDWTKAAEHALALAEGRPIRDFAGPVYQGNPKRTE